MDIDLSPEHLLSAYVSGVFPMADDEDVVRWFAPDPRAIIELDAFTMSRSLRAVVRRGIFEITVNRAFEEVIAACADRPDGTWISAEIADAYVQLHRLGFAHSVEARCEGKLVGGLYGVAIGAAFFGESMFHRVTDASKVALAALVGRLRDRGFNLLDIQFITDHLRRFGAVEIPRSDYLRRLHRAVQVSCAFDDRIGPTAISVQNERDDATTSD